LAAFPVDCFFLAVVFLADFFAAFFFAIVNLCASDGLTSTFDADYCERAAKGQRLLPFTSQLFHDSRMVSGLVGFVGLRSIGERLR
jgi:hypothetical protein